ncbi:MAG: tRNA (N6-isopentenyl adenosine(37)-C2)-methylthiotransferase MiaB [Rhodospirillales bacterium]
MTKKLFVKTYGCQMNVYDSDRMTELLAPLGYAAVDTAADADMVILNTCHIREKAADKVYSELGRLRDLRQERTESGAGDMMIAVAGCVAQAEGAEVFRRAPWVDMVFGPQTYHRLPEMVARAARQGGGVLDTDFPAEPKFDDLAAPKATGVTAFLTIQEGCDKFCTFCVVPYTRGAEYSRAAGQVIAEAGALAGQGVREITLLGQNVNAYHGAGPDGGEWGLGRLLRALADIDGLQRIRYTTSHPRDVDDELIAAHRDIGALMPFLHLPVQSGSDRILSAMNRRHTADDYRRIVDRLRTARPDMVLSSDFIVGYPGESDRDFDQTLKLIRDVGFVQAFSFKYSPRPGTPAAADEIQVEETVKSARLAALQAELLDQQTAFNQSCVGKVMPVLFEKPGRHAGQLVGRTPFLQPLYADLDADRIGEILNIEITTANPNSLSGKLAGADQERACA